MRDEELYLFSHYDHMGGGKIKQEKRFIFSTLKSDLFELLNNFLEEMDRKVLNFHKNLCIDTERVFCLCAYVSLLSCPTPCDPMGCSPRGSSVRGILQQEHWSGQPLPLQGIFPRQGSNPGLPHCRQILYQLGHQGGPKSTALQ